MSCWRARGSTIAELCAAGKPSLLVPLPTAADDHQRKNAEVLAEANAAVMLLQKDVTSESLLETLVALLNDGPRRAVMAERARSLAKPGGAREDCQRWCYGLLRGIGRARKKWAEVLSSARGCYRLG